MNNTLMWLLITLGCIFMQACYSMMEMAAVSMNRVRLAYLASQGVKRALWLQYLLQKPSRLFGTIMLAVNIALQVGSQSSREFYNSLNFDPDIAPFTQIFLVVIFAELAPLFAARRSSEHVIMLGVPFIYFTYRLFTPAIYCIGVLTRFVYRLLGKQDEGFDVFLSRDELQKVLETREEEGDEFNLVMSNIFSLRKKTAHQAMQLLRNTNLIAANSTVADLKKNVKLESCIPLFEKRKSNIVGIVYPRDFLHCNDDILIRSRAKTPWFITTTTKLMPILHQFRRNKESVAIVVDKAGSAVGILTLDAILAEIVGEMKPLRKKRRSTKPPLIERTFQGNKRIREFNKEYQAQLPLHGVETLAQLVMTRLDHPPEPGDSIIVDQFELTAEETNLLGVKSVGVKSLES
ncbi:MAG: HlyC/CorC family transporter [Chlamydiales bacterium]|nr:HlyC/CorC family transporter [Chlamydiales bacterium]